MGQSLDLFAAVSPEGAWTVTQVTRRARAVVEAGLLPLWVRGEISGFKAWQSGHWYFTLRDRSAQIRCVMFQKDNRRPAHRLGGKGGLPAHGGRSALHGGGRVVAARL